MKLVFYVSRYMLFALKLEKLLNRHYISSKFLIPRATYMKLWHTIILKDILKPKMFWYKNILFSRIPISSCDAITIVFFFSNRTDPTEQGILLTRLISRLFKEDLKYYIRLIRSCIK